MDFARLRTSFDTETVAPEALLEKYNYIRAKNLVQVINNYKLLPEIPARILVLSPTPEIDLHLLTGSSDSHDYRCLHLEKFTSKSHFQGLLNSMGQFDRILIRWEQHAGIHLGSLASHLSGFLKESAQVNIYEWKPEIEAAQLPFCEQFYRRLRISKALEHSHLNLGERLLQLAPQFRPQSSFLESSSHALRLNRMDVLKKILIEFSVEKRIHQLPLALEDISEELQSWFQEGAEDSVVEFYCDCVTWNNVR